MENSEIYDLNLTRTNKTFYLRENRGGWKPESGTRNVLEKLGYTLQETIGEGSYSKIKKAYCKNKRKTVAVKIIKKNITPNEALEKFIPREVAILQILHHPSLLDLHEAIESSTNLYLITDYMPNGDLLDHVNRRKGLSEPDARHYFKQMVTAIGFCHARHVYHRDLKLENILLDELYNIRLTDFGFARYNPRNQLMNTFCGSYVYAAPELLDGVPYDGSKADIWSLGVCLYAMLNGCLPFRCDDVDTLRANVREKVKFTTACTEYARHLVQQILSTDPQQRPSLEMINKSTWMTRPLDNRDKNSMSHLSVQTALTKKSDSDWHPETEHGFCCEQKTFKDAPSRHVTEVLTAVAMYHSSSDDKLHKQKCQSAFDGNLNTLSATDINDSIPSPLGITRSIAKRVVKQQPVSRGVGCNKEVAIKSSIGAVTGLENNKQTKSQSACVKQIHNTEACTSIANKEQGLFKRTVRSVMSLTRPQKPPVDSILKCSQSEALLHLQNKREKERCVEMKVLRSTLAAKLSKACGAELMAALLKQHLGDKTTDRDIEVGENNVKSLRDTIAHLLPCKS